MKFLVPVLLFAALVLVAQPKSSLKISVDPKVDVKADVESPIQIVVKNAKGAPVSGAEVTVIATMVDMDHGEFKYEAKAVKPGVYQFSPKFMMGGTWNLAVKAMKGSESQTLNQRVEVKD